MLALEIAELLKHIRLGNLDRIDTSLLEQLPADQFVDDLRSSKYQYTFQERHIGHKWEISLARELRLEMLIRPIPEAVFASFQCIPVYLNCVMLNIEGNHLTGISRMGRLTVWNIRKPEPGLALKSGPGFKLDKTPDGWQLKPFRNRTVKLSRKFLQNRGWRFDHLQQMVPHS